MNGVFWGVPVNVWTIIAAAIVTYATRVGGHMVLSRFKRIPPRVDAARAEVGRLEREALDALAPFGAPGAKLGEMARSLARRTH